MLFASIAAVSLAAGCVGALEPMGPNQGDDDQGDDDQPAPGTPDAGTPPVGSAARAMFEADVASAMAQCGSAGCHGGTGNSPLKFYPTDLTQLYTTVTSYDDRMVGYFDKTTAPMLKRVSPGPHYTATYTADQVTKISAWLDLEKTERATGNPPPTGTPSPGQISKQLISEWSGCMTLADWDADGVAVAFADMGTNQGPCVQCHNTGQASFIASRDSTLMFNTVSGNKYFMIAFFTPNVTDVANAKMEVNKSLYERVGTGVYPYNEHPRFNVNNQAFTKLQSFYTKTMAKKAAGTCGTPKIPAN
jgi:hypothetical protein